MATHYLVGIDIGTTNIKVGAFDEQLRSVAEIQQPTAAVRASDAGSLDAEGLWDTAQQALRLCLQEIDGEGVAAIGVTGMAEAGCLLDSAYRPATPILLWHDERGADQADRWRPAIEPRLTAISGLPLTNITSLAKWAWFIENNAPSQGLWCGVPEWIALCLTGNRVTDQTLAARTGAFNVLQGEYDRPILDEVGVPDGLFPPAHRSPASAGEALPHVARTVGILPSARVFVAGHDDIVAAYGAGARPRDVVDSAGTAEGLIFVWKGSPDPGTLTRQRIAVVPFFWPDTWAAISGAGTTGALMEMVAGRLQRQLAELDSEATPPGDYPPDTLELELSSLEMPKATFRPDVSAPAVWSAVLDVVADRVESAQRPIRLLVGDPSLMIVTGGGARSAELSKRKADRVGARTIRLPHIDATTRGAAALAGRATESITVSPQLILKEGLDV